MSLKNHVVSLAATAAGGAKSPAAGRLNGKVAIVTGAGNGIGRSAAILFAEQGCNVYAVDWNEEGVRETERMIASAGYSGKCEAAKVDVGDEHANRQMVDDCVSSFGALHILFANAGISGAPKPFWELSADDYANTLRVNVVGVGMGFKYAARYMMANKVDNGSLIATASVAGLRSGAGSTDYSASKAAVVSIVQTCANQLAFTGHLPGSDRHGHDRPDIRPGEGERHRGEDWTAESCKERWPACRDRQHGALSCYGRGVLRERPGHRGVWGALVFAPRRAGKACLTPQMTVLYSCNSLGGPGRADSN